MILSNVQPDLYLLVQQQQTAPVFYVAFVVVILSLRLCACALSCGMGDLVSTACDTAILVVYTLVYTRAGWNEIIFSA